MNYDDARIEMFDAEDMSGGFFSEEEELDLIYNDGDSWNGTMDSLIDKYVSLEEGFDITRNNWGYLNLEYWAEITGLTVEQIIYRANGKLMWRDPRQIELGADETVGWLTREQILQGNRIRKIKEAKELNKRYAQMDEVIKLLADNLPEEVAGSDIHVNIGSTWVLEIENFVADFIAELLDVPFPPKVSYDSYRGRWTVEYIAEPNYVLNNYTYGTPQFPCTRILECKLNAKPIKAYDQEYNFEKGYYESVLNRSATLAAQEKAKSVDVRFQDYCHGDKENEERIQNAYASQYGYGLCRFDGDYLALSDAAEKITLYKHQKDAVAHIMACHNVLLAHNVGSGKTYEYSCGLHELIRLGICKKAVVVVPNNTLSAVSKAYQDLFPMDETLVCRPRIEFAPAKRKETLERIKATEKLIVFMAYSSFDMLTMSKKYAFAKKDAELRECAHQIASASSYA